MGVGPLLPLQPQGWRQRRARRRTVQGNRRRPTRSRIRSPGAGGDYRLYQFFRSGCGKPGGRVPVPPCSAHCPRRIPTRRRHRALVAHKTCCCNGGRLVRRPSRQTAGQQTGAARGEAPTVTTARARIRARCPSARSGATLAWPLLICISSKHGGAVWSGLPAGGAFCELPCICRAMPRSVAYSILGWRVAWGVWRRRAVGCTMLFLSHRTGNFHRSVLGRRQCVVFLHFIFQPS